MINVFQPSLREEELEAVREVFESNWVGRGKRTYEFEEGFAAHLGVDRALVRSVSSCTEGMFQAMTLLGIGPGDEVILPTISFVGAGNAVAACGARPVFSDVDPRTLNARAEDVERVLSARTKAVLVLHYGGLPCDVDGIGSLLRERGIGLIEDSACSVASRHAGRACGTFGDIGTWSFDAMKILVSGGDGGMVYCRTPELAERAERLLYLGLESQSGLSSTADRWWEFEVSVSARRSIMNDVSSAIGIVQLRKLPAAIARRREVHERYDAELGELGWLRPPPSVLPGDESSYYFYWIQLEFGRRDALAMHLRERDVYSTFRYYPLHLVSHYGHDAGALPNAELAAASTLCIPLHQALSDDDVTQVVDAIASFV